MTLTSVVLNEILGIAADTAEHKADVSSYLPHALWTLVNGVVDQAQIEEVSPISSIYTHDQRSPDLIKNSDELLDTRAALHKYHS